jgi:flagellar hook-basal body complex protein FliE
VSPLIDPSMATTSPEWTVGLGTGDAQLGGDALGGAGEGPGFGQALGNQIQRLTELQTEAADASRALATGQATDPTSTVMAVEKARLAMQLASQLRTKGVEAMNDIFHTQV